MAYDLIPSRLFSFPSLQMPSIWNDDDDWLTSPSSPSGLSIPVCESKKYACVQTVSFVQDRLEKLSTSFKRRATIGTVFLNFNRKLPIHFNGIAHPDTAPHGGQVAVSLQVPLLTTEGPDIFFVADVAGYLFGFDSQEVQVAIGDRRYIEEVFTKKYDELYPGIKVTLITEEDLRRSVSR